MAAQMPPASAAQLARQAREHFLAQTQAVMAPMAEAIRARLIELVDQSSSTKEMQDRRDCMLDFERLRGVWIEAVPKAWRQALVPPTATARVRLEAVSLELIGDDVVEKKILSSRLALSILDKVTWELNDLRLRVQHLEGGDDLASHDILRPEVISQLMVEQWTAAQLTRETWSLARDVIQKFMVERLVESYRLANEFLVSNGVMPDIELSNRVKRRAATAARRPSASGAPEPDPAAAAQGGGDTGPGGYVSGPGGPSGYGAGMQGGQGGVGQSGYGGQGGGGMGQSGYGGQGGGAGQGGYGGQGGGAGQSGYSGQGGYGGQGGGSAGQSGYGGQGGGAGQSGYGAQGGGAGQGGYGGQGGGAGQGGYGGQGGGTGQGGYGGQGAAGAGRGGHEPGHGGPADGAGFYGSGSSGGGAQVAGRPAGGAFQGGANPGGSQGRGGAAGTATGQGAMGGAADETRLLTASTPLARARMRANGVIGQLRRMLTERVAGFDADHVTRPSPALAEALSQQRGAQGRGDTASGTGTVQEPMVFDDAGVEQVAVALRQRTGELKKKAATSTEKATIEIVALMFQAILAEERIPPAVRVWFARLQMPVLRVAIAEPEFFGTLQHPARQLIDRMGSCVMGFDAATIGGSALETEIKRVVQVIEQYPETGRRVFQLVYDEFQKFLSKFLTEKGATQRLVSVAQQVEQKETMAIQYTIEMRSMLNDMPVREEIREFLFKVWAEVLAMAALKNGPQHEETILLKKSAADLVWAASAKPNRNDRARVIQDLPRLLQRLRQGMTLMGLQGPAQEMHIKVIGDTLADAFLSKTKAIPQAQIEAMTKRLANLEDFVSDEQAGDLPLDAESIELMLGIDASGIEVVADGGSKPSAAMLSWAMELQVGNWFTLDHNGQASQVQYAWRSDRKQLHLFASKDGRSFLIQARRLAAYLQAGLLLPAEDEALTVRATRDALAKLDANPERLLQ